MIAVVIIGLGLLAMLLANTHIQRTGEAAYERVVATQDAHRVIEGMRNASTNGSFPANVIVSYPQGAAVPGFANLAGEQVVVTYQNVASDPLDVTVTTNWLELGRRNTLVRLRTLMTKRN